MSFVLSKVEIFILTQRRLQGLCGRRKIAHKHEWETRKSSVDFILVMICLTSTNSLKLNINETTVQVDDKVVCPHIPQKHHLMSHMIGKIQRWQNSRQKVKRKWQYTFLKS